MTKNLHKHSVNSSKIKNVCEDSQNEEQTSNYNNESFQFFQKDITIIEDKDEKPYNENNENINQSNFYDQENNKQDEILKIINENPDRFKISNELFKEIKSVVNETKRTSKRHNTSKPKTEVNKDNNQTKHYNNNEFNMTQKQLPRNKINESFVKPNHGSNNIENYLKNKDRKRSYSNMSKKEQIRLRHLIPKEPVITDYEKQELFLNEESSRRINKSGGRLMYPKREENSHKVQSGTLLKPYKKVSKNVNEIKEIKRKSPKKLNYKEYYNPSNKHLKNYYDYIYLEKKGKLKLQSSEHPWINDD